MPITINLPGQSDLDALNVMYHDPRGQGRSEDASAADWFGDPVEVGLRLSDEDAAKLGAELAWELGNHLVHDESAYLVYDACGWGIHVYHTCPLD